MKSKKRIVKISALFMALVMTLLTLTTNPGKVMAKPDYPLSFETEASVNSYTQTKLKWKKHKGVTEYQIYNYNEATDKNTLIKTVAGDKKGCTITTKKNKQYSLFIQGIYKSGKKLEKRYWSWVDFYTGLCKPMFDDYQLSETEITPNSIELLWCDGGGLKPSGYEIYRKNAEDTKYEKIATAKKSQKEYTDETVEAGQTYYYKIRSFSKDKSGKKTYSKFCKAVKMTAVWREAILTVSGEAEADEPVLEICSDEGNGEILFSENVFTKHGYLSNTDEKVYYSYKAYSRDGVKWYKAKAFSVNPGEKFYIKLERKSVEDLGEEALEDLKRWGFYCQYGLEYTGFACEFKMDPYAGNASVYINTEFTH